MTFLVIISRETGTVHLKTFKNGICESSIHPFLTFQTFLRNYRAKIENPVSFMRDFTVFNKVSTKRQPGA